MGGELKFGGGTEVWGGERGNPCIICQILQCFYVYIDNIVVIYVYQYAPLTAIEMKHEALSFVCLHESK